MEDLFFDKIGKRFFPYAYFSARNLGLALALFATAAWAYFGWDSTVEYTLLAEKGAYGYGTHWSTVETIFIAFYFLALNLQVGGVKSFRQLASEMVKDSESIALEALTVGYLFTGKLKAAKTLWKEIRAEYLDYASVDPLRGFFFAGGFVFVATTLFELVWVPIYDQVNFGNWAWPVYYFGHPLFGSPFFAPIFLRNNVALGVLGFFGSVMLYTAFDGEKTNLRARFSVKWRFDRYWVCLLLVAVGMWIFWVFMPHSKFDAYSLFSSPSAIQSFHNITSSQLQNTQWLMPTQDYFPQTEYTFYNASAFMQTYSPNDIYGFYAPNLAIHAVNVLTKYATFAAVCYPALVKVKRNEA